ncbi:MAG: hypothetical protein B6U78_02325 [Candidatus Aenigmarchaeota archaeon ex4484_224]|nr:MAG: hypothetical protein B6U78_02325 [Candidatus Aenigmarchaeota archaeon ex4484_224]
MRVSKLKLLYNREENFFSLKGIKGLKLKPAEDLREYIEEDEIKLEIGKGYIDETSIKGEYKGKKIYLFISS